MVEQGNISHAMATRAHRRRKARLNILISGGTGSGKTTLLNALSQMIDPSERIITIEDAAELQLQQPRVGAWRRASPISKARCHHHPRLFRNALRMRPDRIIVGEIRGSESMDMLQAMNSGHDGSLGTIHASGPREALTRIENLLEMSGVNLPTKAARAQIRERPRHDRPGEPDVRRQAPGDRHRGGDRHGGRRHQPPRSSHLPLP